MSENAAPVNQGTGDENGEGVSADGRVRRAALLTRELAEDCAKKMFAERSDGPHALDIDLIAVRPTVEEIMIGQAGVLAALGEKGSDKRAHANRLCADGLIDQEQGLGYVLCDRFGGNMPSPLKARGVGKNAAIKTVPDQKTKERWKDKAKAARQAARKAGADEEAVAAAGQAAREKAEAAFVTTEVSIKGLERATAPPPEPPEPPPPAVPPMPPEGTLARARLDMMMSKEAEPLITAAYTIAHRTHPSRIAHHGQAALDEDEELEHACVAFKHALRRLRAAPAHQQALEGCPWDEDSARDVVHWTVMVHSTGHAVPAALASARRVGFDLGRAAADRFAKGSGGVLV